MTGEMTGGEEGTPAGGADAKKGGTTTTKIKKLEFSPKPHSRKKSSGDRRKTTV